MHAISTLLRLVALSAWFAWVYVVLTGGSLEDRYACAIIAWMTLAWATLFRSLAER
jgi:hypothetical protein